MSSPPRTFTAGTLEGVVFWDGMVATHPTEGFGISAGVAVWVSVEQLQGFLPEDARIEYDDEAPGKARTMREIRRDAVRAAIARTGTKKAAAVELGVGERSVYRWAEE